MAQALHAQALAYLREHRVVSLATQDAGGPWAAAVFYVNDGFTLYFLSAPTSRHSVNLARDPRVAATIQEDYRDWPQIKGVQLAGLVSELGGEQAGHARRLYAARYPLIGAAGGAPAAIAAALDRVRWYRLEPEQLYFIDNSVAFGHREQIIG